MVCRIVQRGVYMQNSPELYLATKARMAGSISNFFMDRDFYRPSFVYQRYEPSPVICISNTTKLPLSHEALLHF